MKAGILLTILGIGAALSLAFAPTIPEPGDYQGDLDHDAEAVCLQQLLDAHGEPVTFGTVVGNTNYARDQYGTVCRALDHYETHGWY